MINDPERVDGLLSPRVFNFALDVIPAEQAQLETDVLLDADAHVVGKWLAPLHPDVVEVAREGGAGDEHALGCPHASRAEVDQWSRHERIEGEPLQVLRHRNNRSVQRPRFIDRRCEVFRESHDVEILHMPRRGMRHRLGSCCSGLMT
ncbi:hypothetical protein [Leifsonia kafniensis]|uniref:hypothetical protein n=1 Tax=Leifsonia kafniensis TaxID=475957 RepID=UPI0031E73194